MGAYCARLQQTVDGGVRGGGDVVDGDQKDRVSGNNTYGGSDCGSDCGSDSGGGVLMVEEDEEDGELSAVTSHGRRCGDVWGGGQP